MLQLSSGEVVEARFVFLVAWCSSLLFYLSIYLSILRLPKGLWYFIGVFLASVRMRWCVPWGLFPFFFLFMACLLCFVSSIVLPLCKFSLFSSICRVLVLVGFGFSWCALLGFLFCRLWSLSWCALYRVLSPLWWCIKDYDFIIGFFCQLGCVDARS